MGSLKWCANYRYRQIQKRRAMQIVRDINKQLSVATYKPQWGVGVKCNKCGESMLAWKDGYRCYGCNNEVKNTNFSRAFGASASSQLPH